MSHQRYRKTLPHRLLEPYTVAVGMVYMLVHTALHAQISIAPHAPANKTPHVAGSDRGPRVVQIVPPNKSGVSHNQYQQFNIGAEGIILSNNKTNATSQLRQEIAANPLLAGSKPASIILNEVIGTQPSMLNGPIEVTGAKADVVISNPNGITANGAAIINANKTTLTTGRPVFGGTGSLDMFRVTGGQINVKGGGLQDPATVQTNILARNVKVDATVWADHLNIVTGNNKIDYTSLDVSAIDGTEKFPVIALDIGEVGGMYAHKIRLIGTESGVGVKDYGEASMQVGDFELAPWGKSDTTLKQPPRKKRMKGREDMPTPPLASEDESLGSVDSVAAMAAADHLLNMDIDEEMPRPPSAQSNISSVGSVSSVESAVLAQLERNIPPIETLPVLSANDVHQYLPDTHNTSRPVDLTPMPLVGGAMPIIPSPLPGTSLGLTPASASGGVIGITQYHPEADLSHSISPQPGPSHHIVRPQPIRPTPWNLVITDLTSQQQSVHIMPSGAQIPLTLPLGIIPIIDPRTHTVHYHLPPGMLQNTSIGIPAQHMGHLPHQPIFVHPRPSLEGIFQYWDVENFRNIFHPGFDMTRLMQSGAAASDNERLRTTLNIMNIVTTSVRRSLAQHPEQRNNQQTRIVSHYHNINFEILFDNQQQRITEVAISQYLSPDTTTTAATTPATSTPPVKPDFKEL